MFEAPAQTTIQPSCESPDATLVRRARRGDQAALDALFRAHRAAAISACVRATGQRADAEDAVQEALLITARRISALPADLNFRAYLCVVARRLAVRRAARGNLTVLGGELEETAGDPSPLSCPELTVLRRESSAAVASAMRQLPDRQRAALIRTAVAGDSYAEVGDDLGLAANAVAQLVHRARTNVRHALAEAA